MRKILFDRIDEPGLNTLEVYERRGGYRALRKALAMTPDDVPGWVPNPGVDRGISALSKFTASL